MINLPEFTENVNIHQSLPDQPTLTPTELKIKWDEGVAKIKNYINNILIPALNNGISDELDSQRASVIAEVEGLLADLEITLKSAMQKLDADLTQDMTALNNELTGKMTTLTDTVNQKISSVENSLKTVANATAVSVTAGSGITLAYSRIIKQGNVVSFYVRITCNIPAKTSRTMFTFPSGARPKSTAETMAIWSNGDFDGRVPAYINTSGVCSLTTSSVAMTDCVIEGQFII